MRGEVGERKAGGVACVFLGVGQEFYGGLYDTLYPKWVDSTKVKSRAYILMAHLQVVVMVRGRPWAYMVHIVRYCNVGRGVLLRELSATAWHSS